MTIREDTQTDDIKCFEQARPGLLGLAYRILGSLADAEDALQETFIKWSKTDQEGIENLQAWLTSVCARHCLDQLRSANRSRVDYVGTWLPEPIHTSIHNEGASNIELASSLTTAFLLMLERLTPKERAAYLLHEIFEMSYIEVANTFQLKETTCRKLVSRAKANIGQSKVRHVTPVRQQEAFLNAFQLAVTEGKTLALTNLLSDDIRLTADGGGKVPTILEPIEGREAVVDFMIKRLKKYWVNHLWKVVDINHTKGFILEENSKITTILSFAYDTLGRTSNIFIMRNPDKMTNLSVIRIR